jgi:hypothetical protein
LASKRRKIEITPAMQLVAKKIASNGSPLISLKRVQKTKKTFSQLNKQKANSDSESAQMDKPFCFVR